MDPKEDSVFERMLFAAVIVVIAAFAAIALRLVSA
jgi:hypothetical protein